MAESSHTTDTCREADLTVPAKSDKGGEVALTTDREPQDGRTSVGNEGEHISEVSLRLTLILNPDQLCTSEGYVQISSSFLFDHIYPNSEIASQPTGDEPPYNPNFEDPEDWYKVFYEGSFDGE